MAAGERKNVISDLPEDVWLLRPCELYLEEFSDCASAKGRFHQYYTVGSSADCERWQQDYKNCLKFRNTGDTEAAEAIIANEKERRAARLKGARENNVWDYRQGPPPEWKADLSKWTNERQESVLAKAQEQKERTGTISAQEDGSRCVIS
ncbi:synaptic plasticity regulator PANTS-like [Littorina saxatilis]|uniref:Synaptic plasticity regulator PANTS n=1 Tax=Littorina saxatilis TaxID=31220 RepID=A0AAN9AIW9_9CAEN